MFWRRLLLLGVLLLPPVYLFGGCGGGVSGPNPATQTGLGTVVVNVNYNVDVVVFLDGNPAPTRGGRAIFYNIIPGRHTVTVSSSSGFSTTVNVIADKTVTVSVSLDNSPTATPFVTPFGN